MRGSKKGREEDLGDFEGGAQGESTDGHAAAAASKPSSKPASMPFRNSKLKTNDEVIDLASRARERANELMKNMTPEQKERFEAARFSFLDFTTVRKIAETVVGEKINDDVAMAIAGVAKLYLGDLIEQALEEQEAIAEEGPLSPDDVREAWKSLHRQGRIITEFPRPAQRFRR
eukprot:ANDGO_03188.mRNA.1 Transcription initiation factor TFIID subunit 11